MKRLVLALTLTIVGVLMSGYPVHAATAVTSTGDGDSQVLYQSPNCGLGPNVELTTCVMASEGSGWATLGRSQFPFHYVLAQTILLGQGSWNDQGFCAPTQGQLGVLAGSGQGTGAFTMTLYGRACVQMGSWQFSGRFVATGVTGMFQGGAGSGTFSGMVVGDRPGSGGCIMWDGTFILNGL